MNKEEIINAITTYILANDLQIDDLIVSNAVFTFCGKGFIASLLYTQISDIRVYGNWIYFETSGRLLIGYNATTGFMNVV